MILQGKNQSFDQYNSGLTDLTFQYLESKLQDISGIVEVDEDILKTLNLLKKDGIYTIAGALLADSNPFHIVDMVRFGEDQDTILSRLTIGGKSLLEAYDICVEKYKEYYQFEVIRGAYREQKERIPERAVREAVANALVHRDWLRESPIQIAMHSDRVVITSPGGLPQELSELEFLDSQVSVMRNPVIGGIFYRLNIIESFGTGIRRIKRAYENSSKKPVFKIYANSLEVTLPVISGIEELSEDQRMVYHTLEHTVRQSSEIAELTGFGKNKVLEILKVLTDSGFVKKTGNGRGTKYSIR